MDAEDDPDLARAIAMSLEERSAPNSAEKLKPKVVIDLISSDEEEDDLDAPISRKHPTPLRNFISKQNESRFFSVQNRKPIERLTVDLVDNVDNKRVLPAEQRGNLPENFGVKEGIDTKVSEPTSKNEFYAADRLATKGHRKDTGQRKKQLEISSTDPAKNGEISGRSIGSPDSPDQNDLSLVGSVDHPVYLSPKKNFHQSESCYDEAATEPSLLFVPKTPLLGTSAEPGASTDSTASSLGPSADIEAQKTRPLEGIRSSVMLGLNRKKMEEDRLARVNQRKRREEITETEANQSRKRKSSTSPPQSPGATIRQLKRPSTLNKNPPTCYPQSNTPTVKALDNQTTGIQFPHGVVKRTWAFGYARENDIKIEEVLQKDTLQLAVLSAFQVDPDWVATKLKRDTKVVWVLQAKTAAEKENIRSNAPDEYRFCFPNMDGQINCMHSKLQLLAHPTHLRIVIPSANLMPYDWGETGVMENTCFIIDLPRLPAGQSTEPERLTDFGKELLYFVKEMGLDNDNGLSIGKSLTKFDYSCTSKLAFIHSIGGSHTGSDWKRTGYCGLGSAVQKLGLKSDGPVNIDFVSASIGSLTVSFAKAIYMAAKGDNGLTELEWRTRNTKKAKEDELNEQNIETDINKNFRIYFPTKDTIAASKGGLGAGGTICFQSKWYDSPTFPKQLMRDCKSTRQGLLMHNKMLFCKPDQSSGGKDWAYIGSANLSESAWGRLIKDKSTKAPKLNLRNWECGVIVPGDLAVLPMVVPGEEYGRKRPWFFTDRA